MLKEYEFYDIWDFYPNQYSNLSSIEIFWSFGFQNKAVQNHKPWFVLNLLDNN